VKRLLGLLLCLVGLLALPAVAQAAPPTTTIYGAQWGDDDSKVEIEFLSPGAETIECAVDEIVEWYECGSEAYEWNGKLRVWFEIWPYYTQGHCFYVRGTNKDGTEASPPCYYRE
jgi:hypothetical protein